MVPIARRHLLAEKSRFALAVIGVAVSVFLIVLIQGLFMGVRDRLGATVEELPFDLWVAQDGTYDIHRTTSVIPGEYAELIAEIPGVEHAESPHSAKPANTARSAMPIESIVDHGGLGPPW